MESLKLAKEVFKEFDKHNIQYCVLRNYEFLLGEPFPAESIDTLIAKKDMSLADSLLKKIGFSKRKQQFSLKHKAYFKFTDNLNKISFDIQVGGIHWNDIGYLNEIVLKNRIKKSYFYVPSNNDTFVMLLVHSILGKRYFKPKYQNILYSLITKKKVDEKYIFNHLNQIFNQKIARKLIYQVKRNKFREVQIYYLLTHFLIKKPENLTAFIKLFGRWVVWKKPFRLGPLISVLGPDGAGKSTLVKNIDDYLREKNRKTAVIYTGRGRDHILPITKLGMKYKRREKKKVALFISNGIKTNDVKIFKKTNKNIHVKKRLIYTITAPIFTLDLLLRYYFRILPERMKKKIVITDRYCSDIMLMQNVPFGFRKFLLGLFPKPTMNIFLYNSAEILHQRRPEESIPNLERQLSIFNQFDYSLKIKSSNFEEDRKKVFKYVHGKLLYNWE